MELKVTKEKRERRVLQGNPSWNLRNLKELPSGLREIKVTKEKRVTLDHKA